MAKERSAGGTVFLVLIALVLLALSLTGKMSDFLGLAAKWLLGSKIPFPVPTAKDKTKDNQKNPPKDPNPPPSPAPVTATADPVKARADAFFKLNPNAPYYIDQATHKAVQNLNVSGAFFGGGASIGNPASVLSKILSAVGLVAL
jgi:hypothetical protein